MTEFDLCLRYYAYIYRILIFTPCYTETHAYNIVLQQRSEKFFLCPLQTREAIVLRLLCLSRLVFVSLFLLSDSNRGFHDRHYWISVWKVRLKTFWYFE